jgi:hypothetical protein
MMLPIKDLMLKMSTNNELEKLHLDSFPSNLTAEDVLKWLKFQDKISPPIRRLLGYDTPFAEELNMVWAGLDTYEDLMFLYINRDLWGFE